MTMAPSIKKCLKSTWTPLSNEDSNNKIFEERRSLFLKWFEQWTDDQRKMVLGDAFVRCRPSQLHYASDKLHRIVPVLHADFSRHLPRVITLYIFSFLDPRSLCRTAQVCWYWRYLAETDELWMPKCCRVGWYAVPLPHASNNSSGYPADPIDNTTTTTLALGSGRSSGRPRSGSKPPPASVRSETAAGTTGAGAWDGGGTGAGSWEQQPPQQPGVAGVWKRFYVQQMLMLRLSAEQKAAMTPKMADMKDRNYADSIDRRMSARQRREAQNQPWRGPNPCPKDIWRNNYLPSEQNTNPDRRGETGRVRSAKPHHGGNDGTTGGGYTDYRVSGGGGGHGRESHHAPRSLRMRRASSGDNPVAVNGGGESVSGGGPAPRHHAAGGDGGVVRTVNVRATMPPSGAAAAGRPVPVPRPGPLERPRVRRTSPDRTDRHLPTADLFPVKPFLVDNDQDSA